MNLKKKILIIVLALIIIAVIALMFFPDIFRNVNLFEDGDENAINARSGAEEFVLQNLSGDEVALSDFRGRRVFLNFWTTWCPACNMLTPYINEIYEGDYDIKIITINLREDVRTIQRYMERNNYDFPVLLDTDGRISRQYRANAIPFSVLLDEDGNVVRNQLRSNELRTTNRVHGTYIS